MNKLIKQKIIIYNRMIIKTEIFEGPIINIIDTLCADLVALLTNYNTDDTYDTNIQSLIDVINYIKYINIGREYENHLCLCIDGVKLCPIDCAFNLLKIKSKYTIIKDILLGFINIFRYLFNNISESEINKKIIKEHISIILYLLSLLYNTINNLISYVNTFSANYERTQDKKYTIYKILLYLYNKKLIMQRYIITNDDEPDYKPDSADLIIRNNNNRNYDEIINTFGNTGNIYHIVVSDMLGSYNSYLQTRSYNTSKTGGINKSNYKKTDKKITVIYKKKKYTRVIYISERKKYVKINKTYMLLSKLKKDIK